MDSRDGGLVTLGQLADFKMAEQVNTINRESGQRRLAVCSTYGVATWRAS